MGEGVLATRVESRIGSDATRRVLELVHEPAKFQGHADLSPGREVDGRTSFLFRVNDDGGSRIVHLRVWRGRGGIAGMTDRFRLAPGFSMWAKAAALLEAGIATPPPLLVAERRPGSLEWSCFASEQVDAAIGLELVLQQVASWSEARQTNFARNLAVEFKKLKKLKFGLDDLDPSSFLVRGVPDFEFELLVCEPERSTIGGEIPAAHIESRILFGLPEKAVKAFFHGLG